MIKVIAVDLGGVYFHHGSKVAAEALKRDYGYDEEIVRKLLRTPESNDLRRGLMTDDEFWTWAQTQLPEGYDAKLIKQVWYDSYILDKDIEDLVKALRGKYKLVVFSGNIRSRVEYLEQKYHFKSNFDSEIYSFDYHLVKPERKFAQVLIDQSGCKPEEILYIDNKLKDAAPGIELGLNVVIYNTGKIGDLKKELEKFRIKV